MISAKIGDAATPTRTTSASTSSGITYMWRRVPVGGPSKPPRRVSTLSESGNPPCRPGRGHSASPRQVGSAGGDVEMAMVRNVNEQIDGNGAAPGAGEHLASERLLWQRFSRNRDPVLREELIGRYMSFAKGLALRYRGASESVDDLIQVANLGLVNAVDRFDP